LPVIKSIHFQHDTQTHLPFHSAGSNMKRKNRLYPLPAVVRTPEQLRLFRPSSMTQNLHLRNPPPDDSAFFSGGMSPEKEDAALSHSIKNAAFP